MAELDTLALSFGDTRNAALYFESVIPCNPYFEARVYEDEKYPNRVPTLEEWRAISLDFFRKDGYGAAVAQMLPPGLRKTKLFGEKYLAIIGDFVLYQQKYNCLAKGHPVPHFIPSFIDQRLQARITEFVSQLGLQNVPVCDGGGHFTAHADGDAVVSLANLNLIETKGVPWEKIVEFRKDKETQDKLRRLRLFVNDNYTGKSKAFIEDHLRTLISDHDEAVRKWQFETKTGALNIFLGSKLLAGTSLASFASVLMGAPLSVLSAAGVSAAVEIGKSLIHFGRQHYALRELKRDNPVSYICDARETLKGQRR
jgi:hypothetical protein